MTTYNTRNPVPSADARDRYDNSQVFDEYVTSPARSTSDRLGVQRKTWAGIEYDFSQFLINSGYEFIGDYDADGPLLIERPSQIFSKDGDYWRANASLTLPYTTVNNWSVDQPKFVSVGDATLRTQLAAANGSTLVGFGSRTLYQKLGEHVSCKDAPFNCVGDGVVDDTAGMQAFLNYLAAQAQTGPTSSPPLASSYTGTYPTGYIPFGTYKLSADLSVGPYTRLVGEGSILKQTVDSEDILTVDLYLFEMSGLQFVGGRRHLVFSNANTNSSMIRVDFCQFFMSRDFSVKTFAIGMDPDGNAYSHLSCDAVFNNCRWLSCHQVMDNCCDSMVLNDPWIQPDVSNLTASTAVINNKGASVTDPGAQTRLFINRGFMIPAIGEYGDDQPEFIRWVDNYGSFISRDVRYGGEFGGMPIVYHFGAQKANLPWDKTEVVITGGLVFSGVADDPFACVIGLQGQVPQYIELGGFSGPVSSPLVANLSSTDLPAYFAAFETASGKKSYDYFKFDMGKILTDVRAYVPLRPMLPNALYDYLIEGRNTRVVKTGQSLANGNVSNIISFSTTPEFDNVGAFVAANPTRITMPNGCSQMELSVYVVIDAGDSLAKAISVQVQDSGGTVWEGVSDIYGYDGRANPFGDGIKFTTVVNGVPGSYWEVNIKHGATTARNLITARVRAEPRNMII